MRNAVAADGCVGGAGAYAAYGGRAIIGRRGRAQWRVDRAATGGSTALTSTLRLAAAAASRCVARWAAASSVSHCDSTRSRTFTTEARDDCITPLATYSMYVATWRVSFMS